MLTRHGTGAQRPITYHRLAATDAVAGRHAKDDKHTKCHMQNPRWPSLLYCLKCCSRDPLGKQRGGDDGTKQKYKKVQKKIKKK